MPAPPYQAGHDGLRLHLRVTPNAGRDAVDGIETRDDGTSVLRLRVSAVPDKGKANAAVIALLARTLRCPKNAIRLISGETARQKTVLVSGDVAEITAILERLESAGV